MARRLSVKQLECHLQELSDFERPKLELEQYATPPHIAALTLNTIHATFNDLDGKFVADLGCGTGRLTVGSLLCGASMVVGFDCDEDALKGAIVNLSDVYCDNNTTTGSVYNECERINFVRADVVSANCDRFWDMMSKRFDTVLMNPPFGTKDNRGIDMLFLKRAIQIADKAVYSLHKTATREHILKQCQQLGVRGKPVAQIRYNLENSYRFHRKKSVDIDVDLWRITPFAEAV